MTKMVRFNYTTINHDARIRLGLSINEYCVFDLIYNLSNNPKNTQMGWCYAKKETLGDYLDIGRATVFRAINKGLRIGLLEKHPEQPAFLRGTSKWYESVMIKNESQSETPYINKRYGQSQNDTPTRLKMRIYKDTNKDNDKFTVEPNGSVNKKDVASVGEILNHHPIIVPENDSQIFYEWQAEAQRIWLELGLSGEPSRGFFKHVKLAFKRKRQSRLGIALSYCKDAIGVEDMEKLFYWRYANEPA